MASTGTSLSGRRKRGAAKQRPISEIAEERQERLLGKMFEDVEDDKTAQRYSHAKKVQRRQRARRVRGNY